MAEASPGRALVDELAADLAVWSARLAPHVVRERDRVFGRRPELEDHGQTLLPRMVTTARTPEEVSGTVRFGPYFLGGNNAAHGGTLPLVFDEVLGHLANGFGRPTQRTAYLRTDFRAITPIGATLRFRGWQVSQEGRKRLLRATLHHGDVLCAEAEALFVALRPGQP